MRFATAFSKNGLSKKPPTTGAYRTSMMIKFYEHLMAEGRIKDDGAAAGRLLELRERLKLIRRARLGYK